MSRTILTYCTNVHPSQTLAQIKRSLQTWTAPLAKKLQAAGLAPRPFPIGLYLSAESVQALSDSSVGDEFAAWLEAEGFRVVTLNCFPYGGFHAPAVKHDVFRPGWQDRARLEYTLGAAEVLAAWLEEGESGPISTSSGTFKAWERAGTREQIARHWIEFARHCERLRERTGREIVLAIEPEPLSTLETSKEVVAFFEEHLFAAKALAVARNMGMDSTAVESTLRRHLAVCYDTCHQAVEFESAETAISRLDQAGIRCGKLQLSNALWLKEPVANAAGLESLRSFAEPRYLHQAVVRDRSGVLTRYEDLPEFFARATLQNVAEARVHFHVPIDAAALSGLDTTRDHLLAAVRASQSRGWTDLFEIETYTFDVFPAGDERSALSQELVPCLEREWAFAHRALAESESLRV